MNWKQTLKYKCSMIFFSTITRINNYNIIHNFTTMIKILKMKKGIFFFLLWSCRETHLWVRISSLQEHPIGFFDLIVKNAPKLSCVRKKKNIEYAEKIVELD
jgi:hypothetical protein